jgi:NADH dehydrogenase
VIIGGGFGGLAAAQRLRRVPVEILLIDRTNHHLFQPLLYQVAIAALSPGDIASPLRAIFRSHRNVTILMGEAVAVDRARRAILMENGEPVCFDILILAPGSRHFYFGKDIWERFAPGLKTLTDALEIRERLLISFETAERVHPAEACKYLTFVIVGGGPTGVELAGALAEVARKGMVPDFPTVRAKGFSIILIEAGPRVLPAYPQEQSDKARAWLEKLGVQVHLNEHVTDVTEDSVYAGQTCIPTVNVIWAAGNRASPLLQSLKEPLDRQGRVIVREDLSLQSDPWIFVIGDAAYCPDAEGRGLPALAPVAMQQGRYVASIIRKNLAPHARPAFVYHDRGNLATVGLAKAVGEISGVHFSGFLAWLLWSLVHIFYLIGFRNRFRVMSEWIWYYLTYRPGAQLIYGKPRSER